MPSGSRVFRDRSHDPESGMTTISEAKRGRARDDAFSGGKIFQETIYIVVKELGK